MPTEKELKNLFKKEAQKEPEKHFPVAVLKEEGFARKICSHCGNAYWSTDSDRKVCGEPDCSGQYTFIGDSPAKKKMDFIQTWKEFSKMFEKKGYTPIKRYPVVARWNPTMDFVLASIADFQPHVVSGEVKPPANPLVVPQPCLRFNDIDNVGITGRHYTGFVMIGQCAFLPAEKYNQQQYLRDIYDWLTVGMGVPKDELQFHEDAWAGGGNMGPSMEFFSRGLEIGNQVYMLYDVSQGRVERLKINVLDMGMGQERPAWFTHGTSTSYEANFPTVVEMLYKKTGIKPNRKILNAFLPYSGTLNVDEVADIEKAWNAIGQKIQVDTKTLKEEILPLSALYSLGDHSRTLLWALHDGALPSNVGGGYNLRYLFRRSFDFVDKYNWDIEIIKLMEEHAKYMKPQFPELSERLNNINEIIEVEKRKHKQTKEKAARIVGNLKAENVTEEKLVELYDSQGISPQMIKSVIPDLKVPDDFGIKVASRHEKSEQKAQTKKDLDIDVPENTPETKVLYWGDWKAIETYATIVAKGKNWLILDQTAFYPTSGGQLHDLGEIEGVPITEIVKHGKYIVHFVKDASTFSIGQKIHGKADLQRRKILAQHHTATHVINGVARQLFGDHIWQNSAEKTTEKGKIDITHYDNLTAEQLKKLQEEVDKIVARNIPIVKNVIPKDEAEKSYTTRIYQGGVAPGANLRIVAVGDLDIEACGGTHLNSTGELEKVIITTSKKIQDGVIRLEYVCGQRAIEYQAKMKELLHSIENTVKDFKLSPSSADELELLAEEYQVTLEKLPATLERFIKEEKDQKKQIAEIRKELGKDSIKEVKQPSEVFEFGKWLFAQWKEQRRELEHLKDELAKKKAQEISNGFVGNVSLDVQTMMKIATPLTEVFLVNNEGFFLFKGSDAKWKKLQELGAKGGGSTAKQGKLPLENIQKAISALR